MKELISTISRREWQFVAWLALAVILITTLPYLYGLAVAPAGTTYNGLHTLSPGDVPVYYSYINQAKNGQWLAKDLFTSEVQTLGVFNIWWSGVGVMAKVFNLSAPLAFQISRILLIPIFFIIAYLWLAYFFKEALKRQVALVFLAFSSGLGFYFAAPTNLLNLSDNGIYKWPIDLWITEAVTFNALFQTSHFIASITLTLIIFLFFLLAFDKNKLSYAIWAGALSLFYFNFHPYYLPVIFGVPILYLFILMLEEKKFLWNKAGYLILAWLISLPSIIYHVWLLMSSPVIAQRALQNVTTISPLIFVLIGYGWLWLGLALGLYFLIKNSKMQRKHLFLLLWLGLNIFLIYSPFPFHSRYTQGLHVILIIFTVIGLFSLFEYLKNKLTSKKFNFWINNPALMLVLFVMFFMTSIFYVIGRDVYLFNQSQNEKVQNIFYLPNDFVAVSEYLSHQPQGRVILAADIPAKFIPSLSGQNVFVAHAHETLFYQSKIIYALMFYADNKNSNFKQKFLADNSIDYVLFSQYEKELGIFNPSSADFLQLAFDSPEVKLYQVVIE